MCLSCKGQIGTQNQPLFYQSDPGTYLYALDIESGKEIWKFKTSEITTGASSDEESLFFGGGNTFYAVNKENGKLEWKVELKERAFCTPICDSNLVYFTSEDGVIYCYDKTTQKEVWSLETESSIINFSEGKNAIYAPYQSQYLISIDKKTGRVDWKFNSEDIPINQALEHQDNVLFGNDSGMMFCVSKQTGELIWEWDLKKLSPASPVVYDNKIYLVARTLLP